MIISFKEIDGFKIVVGDGARGLMKFHLTQDGILKEIYCKIWANKDVITDMLVDKKGKLWICDHSVNIKSIIF